MFLKPGLEGNDFSAHGEEKKQIHASHILSKAKYRCVLERATPRCLTGRSLIRPYFDELLEEIR
jgi:hypothetical protein